MFGFDVNWLNFTNFEAESLWVIVVSTVAFNA